MCRFALVLLLGTLGVYAGRIPRFPRTLPGRIIDGEMAEEGQFPWQASLQSGGSHYCGASILSENFILTAAHCIFLPTTDYTVSVGMNQLSDPNRQTARVASHRQHPDYDEYEIINDYAVIELAAPLDLDGVKAAALQIGEGIPREGQVCRVSGWGVTDPYGNTPDDLMYVDLNHMSNENCKARWSVFDVTIDEDRHICFIDPSDTEGSPCFGDSGGPLMCDDDVGLRQYGVVSFGYNTCSTSGSGWLPSVFSNPATEVPRSWINESCGGCQS